jgi:hypothetical protein
VAGAELPLDHQHPLSGPVAHGVFAHFSHSRGLYEHRDRTRACRRTRANTNAGPGSKWERALLLARTREANRRPVTNGTSQAAQLVAQCLRSYRADAQGLSWRGAGSPYTPTTPPPAVKVGPSARAPARP